MAEADAVLMMMYGSLSALVGAYFGFSGVAAKKWLVVNLETHLRQIREQPLHGNPPL